MGLFQKKTRLSYDPETQELAVRKSICTGEMTVGYIEKQSGKFHELMLVHSQREVDELCRRMGVSEIKTVY